MAVELDSGGGKKQRVKPHMNVTPLVDVVLVLLIIFMVITPMMVKQFRLHVPAKDQKAAAQPEQAADDDVSVVLSLRRDGSIWINRDQVAKAELEDKLARIMAAKSEAQRVVFFDADDDVAYGNAMEILDIARGGGARDIAVLTEVAR